jgi:hypothetical protein
MPHSSGGQIERLQTRPLTGRASQRAASVDIDVSTFVGKGVFLLKCRLIEEDFYLISDGCAEVKMELQINEGEQEIHTSTSSTPGS